MNCQLKETGILGIYNGYKLGILTTGASSNTRRPRVKEIRSHTLLKSTFICELYTGCVKAAKLVVPFEGILLSLELKGRRK